MLALSWRFVQGMDINMEMNDKNTFKDYRFADVSGDDLKKITELEHNICNRTKEEVILIAYQNCQTDSQK